MQTKTDDLILEIKKLQSVIIAASQALMNEKQQ
ncbi:MAG: hypothetical protein RIR90_1755, partial [Bacteroidota bacterium]